MNRDAISAALRCQHCQFLWLSLHAVLLDYSTAVKWKPTMCTVPVAE